MTEERLNKITAVLTHRQNDLTVVLENVFDPHNISAVMRTCDAVGIQEMYILNTKIPLHKKWGKRSSSSALKWLTIHQFDNLITCMHALRQQYDVVLTTHLSHNATNLYELDLTQKTALVFGNEHSGLSEEIIAMADGNFMIPQTGMIRSLNISVACAVTLYEAYRQKEKAGHYQQQKLSEQQYETLFNQWKLNQDIND